jgi:hypothetical protein
MDANNPFLKEFLEPPPMLSVHDIFTVIISPPVCKAMPTSSNFKKCKRKVSESEIPVKKRRSSSSEAVFMADGFLNTLVSLVKSPANDPSSSKKKKSIKRQQKDIQWKERSDLSMQTFVLMVFQARKGGGLCSGYGRGKM